MNNKIIENALAAVIAIGVSQATYAMDMGNNIEGMEKCYGIAKAHQNDCGTATHNCASEAKVDGDPKEWLLVPTGLCKKIVVPNKNPAT